MEKLKFRIEGDSLGEIRVPADALWGASTQRAIENFPISGQRFPRSFIRDLALLKRCAAEVNIELAALDRVRGEAIKSAAQEVVEGKLDDQFPVDIYQTGSGTSTNMNMNEVLARRAMQYLQTAGGDVTDVHPNDHVNRSQSSNDVMPSVLRITAVASVRSMLLPSLRLLQSVLEHKADEFSSFIKVGRTHLMDAVPMSLGDEFGGYAAQVSAACVRIEQASDELCALPLGGTAVGNGLNAPEAFAPMVIRLLADEYDLPLREAPNHFESQAARDAEVHLSGALKTAAVALMKITTDVRWMASGPRAGLAELHLPEVQPGSSIMPAKVNPVIAEALAMVCARVIGNDASIALAGLSGNFELNAMLPLIAVSLLESVELLANAVRVFATRCIAGATANQPRLQRAVQDNLMAVTALVPRIGYTRAVAIAREAENDGRSIRDVARERTGLSVAEIDALLGKRDSS